MNKLNKLYNIILKYVKDPEEAEQELDAFISQGVDGFDDALYANLANDPEFRSVYNIARKKVNELDVKQVSGTKAGVVHSLGNKKYVLKQDVKNAFTKNYIPGTNFSSKIKVTLPKGTIIHNLPGGVYAKHPSLEKYEQGSNAEKYGVMIYSEKDTLSNIEKSSSLDERYRPNLESKGWEAAQKVIRQLQSSVFRKLDDDELLEFRKAMADAFNLDGILKEQADHVSPMVVKAYKEYLQAKKNGSGEKEYRYYSKKLNNTYSTRADRDAIEAILKKKYGSPI